MRPPCSDEAERTARPAALQAAPIQATNAPAAIVQRCQDTFALAQTAAAITYCNALGDVATGTLLAEAGMRAAAVQAEIYLAGVADAAFTAAMVEALGPATAGAGDRLAVIVATVCCRAGGRP